MFFFSHSVGVDVDQGLSSSITEEKSSINVVHRICALYTKSSKAIALCEEFNRNWILVCIENLA